MNISNTFSKSFPVELSAFRQYRIGLSSSISLFRFGMPTIFASCENKEDYFFQNVINLSLDLKIIILIELQML